MRLTFLTLLLTLVLNSCKQHESKEVATEDMMAQNIALPDKKSAEIERQIIKEGKVVFETSDTHQSRVVIGKLIQDLHGYIASENTGEVDGKYQYEIAVRVPAANFERLLSRTTDHAGKLDYKDITALDVTEEFIDVQARLKTSKTLENKYYDLLKKATKVTEILAIEKEIGTLRSEIDSMEGRLKYLKDRVAMSTLTINFYEKTSIAFDFTSRLSDGLEAGWKNLLWFFIGLVNVWPFVLIALVIIVIWQRRRRNSKKNAVGL